MNVSSKPQKPPLPSYEAPTVVVIGPVRDFTFGSLNNGNDGGPQTKN